MLSLSLSEQKQIAGGYYQVMVYARNGAFVNRANFGNYQAAQNYARGRINAGYRVEITRI